ncbi:O-unit flippase [Clostridium perfringens]|uniref:lipopolysaccharide biosynthesis protein n=1 Tax=Clostridium perfringens TaxID=1502 RepID=UPI001A1BDC1A|nr:O-unit flippase [Clostridium perfringens]MDM0871786.1 O-unit flippase [Clostridium perfringens]MDM0874748.1 O-unit flippase [Clostridium perfringens]MDM0883425.1 O-unit flippase [Clostridium perfringens]MDM1025213.1 O-unit flippase [Clostridium perfringens]
MRTKKASINAIINVLNYLIMMLPNFFIRKIFIETLGTQLLGLNSLYQNIVGFLCISELGLSLVISYALYDPIAKDDRKLIKGYIDYYTKFYIKVSCFIFIIGISITPFISIFVNGYVKNMKLYFIMFLINTCITYLFSAKFCLLSVSQENYIITTVQTIINLLMTIVQIIILKYYPNYFLFILVQIVAKLIQMLILNYIISKKFSWLKKENGYLEKFRIKDLYKTMKGLFFHKISAMVLFATDNIVISSFLNLTTVANFGNYYLVISGVQTIMIKIFDGVTASIGNLLTEKNRGKAYYIFDKLQFMAFVLTSSIAICVLNSVNIFITLWVGKEYLLDNVSIFLLVMNFYFLGMRLPIEKFKETSGIYHEDRYWAVFQAVLNLIISIIMVNFIGLPGVFFGTFISNYSVEFWVKPRLVYKKVFKCELRKYFYDYLKYLCIFIGIFILSNSITKLFYKETIASFILINIITILIISIVYWIIFRKNSNFIYFKKIILKIDWL